MFIIIKMALVTCAFYLGIAILLDIASFVVAARTGGIMFALNYWMWGLIFAFVWLISFVLAWLVFMLPFIGRILHPPFK